MTIHYWHSRKTRPKTIHSPNLNFYFRIVKEFGKFKALLWMLENFWVVLTSKCFLTNQVLWAEQNNFDFQIDNFRSINIENKCNGEKMQWWLYWWRQVILSENDGFVDAGSRFATFHQCWPQIGSNGFLIWIRRMKPNM